MAFRKILNNKLLLFVFSLIIAVICLLLASQLILAWTGPTAAPPGDNVPGVIWNLDHTAAPAQTAEFNISGHGKIGQDFWMASGKAIRADAAGDTSIWFGNWGAGATGFKLGVTDEVEAFGSVSSTMYCLNDDCITEWPTYSEVPGCFGPTMVGITAVTTDGNQGGYAGANARCAAEFPGSHVCTADEVIKSYNCGAPIPAGVGWVSGGPPGYIAPVNDCEGWKSNAVDRFGRIWNFTTGASWATTCNVIRQNACCK